MALRQWVIAGVVAVGVVGPACAPSAETDEALGVTRQALGETITTDKAAYTVGESVVLTFANLPGNYYDWVAIAPVGSAPEVYTRYAYTRGKVNGSATLAGPPAGDFVARAFLDNSYTVLAESAPFTIAPQNIVTTVSTDKASYTPSESVLVTFSGMAGYQYDWLSIAPPGSDSHAYVRWASTRGQLSGTIPMSLAGLNGTFVVRAHFNNAYAIEAESAPFTVAAAGTTISVDKGAYASDETVSISYANMQGTYFDWIAIAPQGAPDDEFSWWTYTKGVFSDTVEVNTLPQGTFVARAYFNNDFVRRAESAPFTVAGPVNLPVTLVADKPTFSGLEPVIVHYTGMAGTPTDWIGGFHPVSDNRFFRAWSYTKGTPTGVGVIWGLSAGSWELRAFFNDEFVLKGRTGPITITTAIETDKATYAMGETIAVRAGGMLGALRDWVSVSAPGAPDGSFRRWRYTGGWPLGTYFFDANDVGPGTYVARAHYDDESIVRAESASFTITP